MRIRLGSFLYAHYWRINLPTNLQTALKDLSSNNNIVVKEADKRVAITVINKDDHKTDCNILLEDNSTYHKTTTDLMETHLKEVGNLLNSITIANEQHVSKLFPTQSKPGKFYALHKLHRLKQLMCTKYNNSHLNKTLINTEQIT